MEDDWGKLLGLVDALALWSSQREKEVKRMERAIEWWERSGRGKEQALEEEERTFLEMKKGWRELRRTYDHSQVKDSPAAAHPVHSV